MRVIVMKLLLSPAKSMNLNGLETHKMPPFYKEALSLRKSLQTMSISSVECFFKVSHALAHETKKMFQISTTYEAWTLFDGIAFKTLKEHLQHEHHLNALMILSGLYGIIQAKDGISPYRLDLKHPKKGNLSSFYRPKIYELLKEEPLIYVLVSKEYEVLLDERLSLIHFTFYDGNNNAPSVEAKKLRGYIAASLLNDPNTDLNAISYLGYQYDSASTFTHYIYRK
jgi:uncharacterized protein